MAFRGPTRGRGKRVDDAQVWERHVPLLTYDHRQLLRRRRRGVTSSRDRVWRRVISSLQETCSFRAALGHDDDHISWRR